MERVGERLRREREARDTSIEALSAASGIGQSYLEALERGEIDALPGPAFGKLYIRAYAEVLGFDPQPWIDDYDRERRLLQGDAPEPAPRASAESRPVAAAIARWKESRGADKPETVEEEVPEPAVELAPEPVVELAPEPVVELAPEPAAEPVVEPAAEPTRVAAPPHRPNPTRRLVPALVVILLVAIASWMCLARRPRVVPVSDSPAPQSQLLPPSPSPPEPAPREPAPPARVAPKPTPPEKAAAPERERAPAALSVTESGTGRRVVDSRLEGEGTEFAEGEAVVFQTRVLGGSRGDAVRHVWIYDGRAQQSITLRLGGPDWRTFSKKTLYRRGPWRVEARDRDGRVLAQAAFTCVPASR